MHLLVHFFLELCILCVIYKYIMPTQIPFDPSLVLGNIVDPKKITALEAVDAAQKPVNLAQEKLNALILSKRSLDMTVQEMIQMQVDAKDMAKLTEQVSKTKSEMAKAAVEYAAVTASSQIDIQKAKEAAGSIISEQVESPIDWNKSAIKKMDLSSDSMVMDAQYFRCESENDGTESHSNAIATYVSGQVSSIFGPTYGAKAGSSAKNASLAQSSAHELQGTLVITANCTHKAADMFAPFVMDPEKAIRAWNVYNKGSQIDTTDEGISKALADETAKMFLLSGQTHGSSFVGMVHLVKTEKSDSHQSTSSSSFDLEASFEENCWLESSQGKFGVDGSFANSIKELLSSSNVQAHASVITMGIIPTIKSNEIKTTVSTLQPDATKVMDQLAKIQSATDGDVNNMATKAQSARTGQSFMELNNSYVSGVVSNLGKIDTANNKIIDTNSLMTAFDDYVQKAIAGDCGVPINFFLKPITAKQLASAYLAKFSPMKYWQYSSGDDDSKAEGDSSN